MSTRGLVFEVSRQEKDHQEVVTAAMESFIGCVKGLFGVAMQGPVCSFSL